MKERSPAEWVTFGIAVIVVVVVVGFIAVEIPGSKTPAAPGVEVGAVEERSGRFVVPVSVTNDGERTAADVQIVATLEIDGDETESEATVDFLSGGEVEELEFEFEDDPADGELEVRVGGYQVP